ncbi:hypothetical protein ACSCB1_40500 [Streptomyces europaeiscabiei]|uniref:hypothetical protein n=1 Tax=Streptomyces europaeiscabiei TaxID=146819 RepID=UPI0006284C6B|nr:hypothetical protein [Streptomyces europaeiscabiei]MDX2528420.1 hypothetical protein [Streptomyces europaeiscabiei]MDX2762200.1 hypothetical protein [Streptomyces europaeiscabiei]MDX2768381.1 hypothetical protein [Streptomyces europaeiscabiei]MDX3668089.1 hypothetical protein [Streptomyces europaeiscabiei]MDX3709074.1 hypothetical protein [Streptomyces europaeiscabiei]
MRLRRLVPRALLAACLTGCGGVDGGVHVEGPAATKIPWTGPVYMTDSFGRAWQRPVEVLPTRRVSLDEVTWRVWGSSRALATGVATDFTCVSGCPDGDDTPPSYRVEVVLSNPVRRGDVAFYSHMTLTPVHPPAPFWASGSDDTDLDVPDA